MSKPVITIFGATGAQGGSVAKIFLNDAKLRDSWTVRAVTRDTTKDSAKALASKGAEVVQADLNNPASLEAALKGATAAFAVTNYWETLDKDGETRQGISLADAAKAAGVKHFVWSTLPNVTKSSNGVLKGVLHFDSKAAVDDHIRSINLPTTFFNAGIYMSGISGFLRKNDDGSFGLSFPYASNRPAPAFDSEADTGKYVAGIILAGPPAAGEYRSVLSGTAYITPDDVLAAFRRAYPKAKASYYQPTHKQFKDVLLGQGLPDFAAEEILQNFRLIDEFGYYFGADIEADHKYVYGGPLTTMEEHFKNAKSFQDLA